MKYDLVHIFIISTNERKKEKLKLNKKNKNKSLGKINLKKNKLSSKTIFFLISNKISRFISRLQIRLRSSLFMNLHLQTYKYSCLLLTFKALNKIFFLNFYQILFNNLYKCINIVNYKINWMHLLANSIVIFSLSFFLSVSWNR